MNNIIEIIKNNDLLKLGLVVVAIYFFMQYYNKEKLENVDTNTSTTNTPIKSFEKPLEADQMAIDDAVADKKQLKPDDLLPNYNEANDFTKQNPVSKLLQEQNFLTASYHQGINTVGNAKKIAYLDLRNLPPIPKQAVGPWNNSSYDTPPGHLRKNLDGF